MKVYSPLHTKQNSKNDEYYTTPLIANYFIDVLRGTSHKRILEPFYGSGRLSNYLIDAGREVIGHKGLDFFSEECAILAGKCDIIVSNPPFTKKWEVFERLLEFKKPFIMLIPINSLNTIRFKELFSKRDDIAIALPPRRLAFENAKTGEINTCSFGCCFLCCATDHKGSLHFIQ